MERMFFFGSLSTIGFGLLAPHDSTNLSGVRVDGDGAKIVVFEFDAGRLLDFDRSVFDQFDQSNIREFVRLGLKDEEHAGREGDREQHRVEDEVESMVWRLFAFSIAFAIASIFAVVVVCHLVFGTEEWSCDALELVSLTSTAPAAEPFIIAAVGVCLAVAWGSKSRLRASDSDCTG